MTQKFYTSFDMESALVPLGMDHKGVYFLGHFGPFLAYFGRVPTPGGLVRQLEQYSGHRREPIGVRGPDCVGLRVFCRSPTTLVRGPSGPVLRH